MNKEKVRFWCLTTAACNINTIPPLTSKLVSYLWAVVVISHIRTGAMVATCFLYRGRGRGKSKCLWERERTRLSLIHSGR